MPSTASRPACRWSGWSRYRFHGSCPSTTVGWSFRIQYASAAGAGRTRARRPPSRGTRTDRWRRGRGGSAARPGGSRRAPPHRRQVPAALGAVGADEVVDHRPGGRPLGERCAASNSTSSGWAPMASATAGVGRFRDTGWHRPGRRRIELRRHVQVGGEVDVPPEGGIRDEPSRGRAGRPRQVRGAVGLRRRGAKPGIGRHAQGVGAVAASIRGRA